MGYSLVSRPAENSALFICPSRVAHALHEQVRGERVHRLHAHAVHADGSEIALEVAARVHLGVAIDHLVQGDAAPVVAHGHAVFLDGDIDDFAVAVHELVDGVVHHLLQEHVDAVVVRRAVALLADVHAGSRPDVLVPIQGYNVIILIICHITVLQLSNQVFRSVETCHGAPLRGYIMVLPHS